MSRMILLKCQKCGKELEAIDYPGIEQLALCEDCGYKPIMEKMKKATHGKAPALPSNIVQYIAKKLKEQEE